MRDWMVTSMAYVHLSIWALVLTFITEPLINFRVEYLQRVLIAFRISGHKKRIQIHAASMIGFQ